MPATKGNKYAVMKTLIVQTHNLAKDLKAARARIKALEAALAAVTKGEHPLLQVQDVSSEAMPSKPKSTMAAAESPYDELYEGRVNDATGMMGSLLLGENGKVRHLGESASSDDKAPGLDPREIACLGMPSEIVELSNAFPMGVISCMYDASHFTTFLPPRSRALELLDLYYGDFTRLHLPIPHTDMIRSIFDPIYGINEVGSAQGVHPHKLSVFFVVLASGTLNDNPTFASCLAQQYYVLARAAFSIKAIAREANTATVQAMFMIIWFLHMSDHENTSEERWLLAGICFKTAHVVDRDSAGWKMDEDEIQRRRILFWELYTYDAWSSVKTGRPPSMTLQYTDCRYPEDHEPPAIPAIAPQLGFQAWKFRFSVSALTPIIHYFFGIRKSTYAELMDLDKKIRQLSPPDHLKAPTNLTKSDRSWSSDPNKAMQQFTILGVAESNLLYIHRSYFAQAIHEAPLDPLKHKFGPSVMASYRGSYRLISGLRDLYLAHPETTARQQYFWSIVFSACVVFAALVIKSPGSILAKEAFPGLERIVQFYEMGTKAHPSPNVLNMLQKLLQRAQDAFTTFHSNGQQPSALPNQEDGEPDELAILGGRKSIITPKSTSQSPEVPPPGPSFSPDPDSSQSTSFDFDLSIGAAAPAAFMQSEDNFDMSIFFKDHVDHDRQENQDSYFFNMPSINQFMPTETTVQNSAMEQTYIFPGGGILAAEMPRRQGDEELWSHFANQLLP
ncbi:hypothetical protein HWV62_22108 [Athelia sp. TMB]|nr:hypothetical protein HWV62_22108 [Athelia sp. TMB]